MFFLLFLILNLNVLIPAQIFNPIAELVILIGTPNKEAKPEIEIHR